MNNTLQNEVQFNKSSTSDSKDMEIPLIVQIPILLLNAESNFHLHSDSRELMIALKQCDSLQESKPLRQHGVMPSRHHLSIMWDFGRGFLTAEEEWSDVHLGNIKMFLHNECKKANNSIRSWLS